MCRSLTAGCRRVDGGCRGCSEQAGRGDCVSGLGLAGEGLVVGLLFRVDTPQV
jgi:hypothetical protein